MPRGKCDTCMVRWTWNDRLRVADALCPNCQRTLKPTSQNSLLPLLDAIVTWNQIVRGPKYLTARPAVLAKLRRDLKKKRLAAQLFGNLKKTLRKEVTRGP